MHEPLACRASDGARLERVLEDVREGYVSIDQARAVYGVAIDPVTLTVLADETVKLRATPDGT